MPRKKYTMIGIPQELTNIIDRVLKPLGYSSRAELVKEAVREKLEKLGLLTTK